MRVAPATVLNEEERNKLTQLAKSRTVSVRLARRAQIVLLAATGKHNDAIAQELKIGESGSNKRGYFCARIRNLARPRNLLQAR